MGWIWLPPHSHTICRWSGNGTSGVTDGMWLCSRLAVLQLAVAGSVFLLDMVHLPRRVREKTLRRFVSEVFGSTSTLKLGMYVSVGVSVSVCLSICGCESGVWGYGCVCVWGGGEYTCA